MYKCFVILYSVFSAGVISAQVLVKKSIQQSSHGDDVILLKKAFSAPSKPSQMSQQFWLRYGGVGKRPRRFSDLTQVQIQKASKGSLSFYSQLAYIYFNENEANKKAVRKLFLQCVTELMKHDYSAPGTTYLVSRTKIMPTTLLMAPVLNSAGLYNSFIEKWLMRDKFLESENPVLNMDWVRDRLPMCWAFAAHMNDTPQKISLLKKLQKASSEVIERLFTEDGGGIHHLCDHISYSDYSAHVIAELVEKIHSTKFRLSEQAVKNLKSFAKTHALASLNLKIPGNLSARSALSPHHFKSLPKLLLIMHEIEEIEGIKNGEMISLFLGLSGRHESWKKPWLSQGYKASEISGHVSFNISSAAIHRRKDWLAVVNGNRNPFKGIEMYTEPGTPRSFMRNACFGSLQIFKRRLEQVNHGYQYAGWDHNHFPAVTAQVQTLRELLIFKNTSQIRNASTFAQGTSLEKNGIWGMIVQNGKKEICRKSAYFFDNRITFLTSDILVEEDGRPTHTTLFQYPLANRNLPTVVGKEKILAFPSRSELSMKNSRLIKDNMDNTYYIHSNPNTILEISRVNQRSYDLSKLNKNTPESLKSSRIKSLPSENFESLLAYCEPQKDDFEKVYITHRGPSSKLAYTVFINGIKEKKFPYKILRQDKLAHILLDLKSNTSCYTIFEKDKKTDVGFLRSSSRPLSAMIKTVDDSLNCSVSCTDTLHDQYLKGQLVKWPKIEPLVLEFKGLWKLGRSSRKDLTCIHRSGGSIVTIPYKSYIAVNFKLEKQRK
jgi:chondroitin-sulfate-ABC endolyase/exolyase